MTRRNAIKGSAVEPEKKRNPVYKSVEPRTKKET